MPQLVVDTTAADDGEKILNNFMASIDNLAKVKQSILEKIRNMRAQVEATTKEAALPLLQLAQSTKRQLGRVFHRFEDEASNLQVLIEQTQSRLAYVSILAGTEEDRRQGMMARLTEIDDLILEYEDQRDEMALDVKKKMRRKSDQGVVSDAKVLEYPY
jgi:hypothetical protein